MPLAAHDAARRHGGKSLRAVVDEDVVLDHCFMGSGNKYPMLAMATDRIVCDQDTCSRLVADPIATAVDHSQAAQDTAISQEDETLPFAHRAKGDIHGALTIDTAVALSHPGQGDAWRHIQWESLAGL
jgi:hypothetical protein